MIPAAYGLKRLVAQHQARYWHGETLNGFLKAPVYVFADEGAFHAPEVADLILAQPDPTLGLPHDAVIFELQETHEIVRTQLAYAWRHGSLVEAVFFTQNRETGRWGDVLVHAELSGCNARAAVNPLVTAPEARENAPRGLRSLVLRAIAILSQAGAVREQVVSSIHRPKLARAGVRGWSWHQVEIVPERPVRRSAPQGGTHASPRWHIRRGHWRQLADGRRVFVRECQVGDAANGGVLKDYTVGKRAA